MQRHALALGYFFLSVFSLAAISHTAVELVWVLLAGAMLSFFAGVGYLVWAWHEPLATLGNKLRERLGELYREARQEPHRPRSDSAEGYM